jgi:hypothetical protein
MAVMLRGFLGGGGRGRSDGKCHTQAYQDWHSCTVKCVKPVYMQMQVEKQVARYACFMGWPLAPHTLN